MGQYYKPYLKDADGRGHAFCPQNAICKTALGLGAEEDVGHGTDVGYPDGYWDMFSGLKLMEHSWMGNDFVNGIVERIWDEPCAVAWVGDYACGTSDFNDMYTEDVYQSVWNKHALPEEPFGKLPEIHRDGYLVDLTKGEYVDLEEYVEAATYKPRWAEGEWCIHPLPLLTAIGNGRGGGDYHGAFERMVGSWAMDEIMYTQDESKVDGLERVGASGISFRED